MLFLKGEQMLLARKERVVQILLISLENEEEGLL